jgi:hypothetical protein
LADLLHAGKKASIESPNAEDGAEGEGVSDAKAFSICLADEVLEDYSANDVVPLSGMAENGIREVEIHLVKRNKKEIIRNKRKRHTREDAR